MKATPGPQPMGNTATVKVAISPEIDAALTQYAELTGRSKATLVRYSLLFVLSVAGMLPPDSPDDIIPTLTRNLPTERTT
jgi:hypothetical protein